MMPLHPAIALLLALPLVSTAVESTTTEIHGQFDGAPFWARWLAPSAAYGGKRVLQLVYTPPKPASLDGTHLIDCPFLLLDGRARIVAWNGRGNLSCLTPLDHDRGYRVSRETELGDDHGIQVMEHRLESGLQWDLRLVPLHLALVWTATGEGRATAQDLFAAKPTTPVTIRWSPGMITIGTVSWSPIADAGGMLATLKDDAGVIRIQVAGRKP